jgi:hypothetical protein
VWRGAEFREANFERRSASVGERVDRMWSFVGRNVSCGTTIPVRGPKFADKKTNFFRRIPLELKM